MFSQACVKNSVHGGVQPLGRHHPPHQPEPPPPLGTATAADAFLLNSVFTKILMSLTNLGE